MDAGGNKPGKTRHPTASPKLGSLFKPPPPKKRKKFPLSHLPFVDDIKSNGSVHTTQNNNKDNNAQPSTSNEQVSSEVPVDNMFNIGNKTLEDAVMNDNDASSHSSTDGASARKEKIPPLVVAGTNATDMQNLLKSTVPSGKFSI